MTGDESSHCDLSSLFLGLNNLFSDGRTVQSKCRWDKMSAGKTLLHVVGWTLDIPREDVPFQTKPDQFYIERCLFCQANIEERVWEIEENLHATTIKRNPKSNLLSFHFHWIIKLKKVCKFEKGLLLTRLSTLSTIWNSFCIWDQL